MTSIPAHGFQVRFREKAAICQDYIQGFHRMPFTLYVPVTKRIFDIIRTYIQHLVIQNTYDVNTGKTAPCMSGAGILDIIQQLLPVFYSFYFEFISGHEE